MESTGLFDGLLGTAGESLISLRRELHCHPELGWQETGTAERVIGLLKQMGLSPKILTGGIICDITSSALGPDAPRIGFRADMDALPLQEESGVEFASTVPGVMHACGHDCHTAMLLMAAGHLVSNRPLLRRNVRLLFTKAEEIPPGGEPKLIEARGAEGISEVYGLHVFSELPTGVFATRIGPISSYSDRAYFTLTAVGGHAMNYGDGTLPSLIDADAELTHNLRVNCTDLFRPNGFVHRTFAVSETRAPNIVPGQCRFELTLRARNSETYRRLREHLDTTVNLFREGNPWLALDLRYVEGHIATVNDEAPTTTARRAANVVIDWSRRWSNHTGQQEMEQLLGGESFGRFHEAGVPANFTFLGAGGTGKDDPVHGHPHHSPRFNPDERALILGVAYWLALATQH